MFGLGPSGCAVAPTNACGPVLARCAILTLQQPDCAICRGLSYADRAIAVGICSPVSLGLM